MEKTGTISDKELKFFLNFWGMKAEEEEFLALQRYSSIKLQANYNSDGSWKHANRIHP